jgi:hypothetical protein
VGIIIAIIIIGLIYSAVAAVRDFIAEHWKAILPIAAVLIIISSMKSLSAEHPETFAAIIAAAKTALPYALLLAAAAGFVLAVVCIVRAILRPLKYTYSAVLRFAHIQSQALERGAFIALLQPGKARYRMQIERMINYAILKHEIIELTSEKKTYLLAKPIYDIMEEKVNAVIETVDDANDLQAFINRIAAADEDKLFILDILQRHR